MGELEAAGEIVTGGLLGRAVEPKAGEAHGHAELCLNCGTALIGPNCHQCGQSGHVHRSLGAIGHEIVHGVAHFEGKLWRTLPLLAWRPGELTRRYVEGERARFVSPMAIFLFSIFTMFAVFQIVGLQPSGDITGDLNFGGNNSTEMVEKLRQETTERRADAIEARDKRPVGDPRRARYEERIAEADTALRQLDAIPKAALNDQGVRVRTGWYRLDKGLEKWQKNPSLMLYKLQTNVYKFSWLLIPLSLPFVWLLFCWKRQYRLYDHTVFITYSIAFMSLLFIVITLASTIGVPGGWLVAASLILPPLHLLRQLKQAYSLRWFSAVLRTLVMLVFITVIVSIFLSLLAVMGSLG